MSRLNQFNSLFQELTDPIVGKNIPPKMHDKLLYLAKRIREQPINLKSFTHVDPLELINLDQMTHQSQISLFVQVTKCLIGKQQLDFVERKNIYAKKNWIFSFWRLSYIDYDHEKLYITRKGVRQGFELQKLKVSEKVEKNGDLYTFLIDSAAKSYLIGIQNKIVSNQLLHRIFSLISTSKLKPQQLDYQSQQQNFHTIKSQSCFQDIKSKFSAMSELKPTKQMNIQQIQQEENYRILQNFNNLRILQNEHNHNDFKVFLLIENTLIENVIEYYCKTQEWNIEVIQSSIINKIDYNTYTVYERFKPYSYMSWSRDCILMKYAFMKDNKYCIVEKSVSHQEYPQNNLTSVRADIIKRITTFTKNNRNQNTILMTMQIQADFNGRNTQQDNKNMIIKILKAYDNFPSYCIQKSLSDIPNKLFNFENNQGNKQSMYFQNSPSINAEDSSIMEIKVENYIHDEQQIIQLSQHYLQDKVQSRLIILLDKKEHEKHYLKYRYLIEPKQPGKRHVMEGPEQFIFQNGDWVLNGNKQMVFINQHAISAQKDVLKYIFKQIGKNILNGKSVMNMSLPVDIFDSRSILERNAASLGYAPIFLTQGSRSNDPVQQIKYGTTFLISTALLQFRIEKPFNPILGETFQGYLGGIPIYYEQVSHHPPISSFYCKTEQFQLYGNLISQADMGLNSCLGTNPGFIKIKFKNNEKIELYMPAAEVSGLLYGQRKFKLVHKGYVINKQKLLVCEVSFGKDKRDVYPASTQNLTSSDLHGGIFKVTQEFMNKLVDYKLKYKFSGLTSADVVQKISKISGVWIENIKFDEKVYLSRYDPLPYKLQYQKYSLPSNSNYRQDILYKRMGDLAMSQISKQKLEQIQRNDRKLRNAKKH